jgi:hypothetical protein
VKPSLLSVILALAACHPAPAARTASYDASPDAGMFDLLEHAADDALNTLPPPPRCSGGAFYVSRGLDASPSWECAPLGDTDVFAAVEPTHCAEVPTDGGRGEIRCLVRSTVIGTVYFDRMDAGAPLTQPSCPAGETMRVDTIHGRPTVWCER